MVKQGVHNLVMEPSATSKSIPQEIEVNGYLELYT